ncbi:MAG: beta-lactamase family protein, partial [Gammaproteobacteria bacterium]|nr:beta-lactamase family protein [Gammaproteobacteria bacterium]
MRSLRIVCVVMTLVISSACGIEQPKAAGPNQKAGIERLDGSRIPAQALTAKIEALMSAANVQGLVVAVLNDNEPVYERAFGFADKPNARPLRLETGIYGASLSKAVFAMLVMKLVGQGLLDLDEPLQKYVDAPLCENTGTDWHEDLTALCDDPRYRDITARMALAHTTGMPGWRWFEPDQKLRIKFEPGERYFYSGEGMVF